MKTNKRHYVVYWANGDFRTIWLGDHAAQIAAERQTKGFLLFRHCAGTGKRASKLVDDFCAAKLPCAAGWEMDSAEWQRLEAME